MSGMTDAGREFYFVEVVREHILVIGSGPTLSIESRRDVGSRRIACYAEIRLWEQFVTSTHQSICRILPIVFGKYPVYNWSDYNYDNC